ncbi:DeoR/GlpR family DNA-binding transcription regulator [Paenibacillus sedimenti]|uniref:DeoR/GlpR transcriptional regulator n=1 Tax=Paenibacillus sedimenti TaxID=2770274 RepID=A0A926QHZ7_9BACL|nr:DeoR/GlpR family DNA-binding transcription regulator [Paenibacillus sedimenti]MBD0380005.1 DeoR/GlpR transcriptional regulator [Paenibacillus sedimenti]
MFAIERLNKIKELLLQQKRVDVFELSEKFSVTEVTIRRDLDKLEQTGFLVKTYGGAVLNDKLNSLPTTTADTDQKYAEEKRMIGKIAAQMVEDGEAIFLGAGSTCLEIARNIKDKKVTVLTNDLAIGLELKDASGLKTIVIGGDLVPSSTMLVGGFALQMLRGIYVNKAFIGVKGAQFDSGYTVSHYDEAMILQEVGKISSEIIIAADYSKFNLKGFARLGDLTMAKKVITNTQIPGAYKKYYFEQAVKLYTTFEFK